VRAVAVLSGTELDVGHGSYGGATATPLLVVQSDADACNIPSQSSTLYDAVAAPHKWFLELHGATHLGPYTGADAAASRIVAGVTTEFFDAYLRHVLGSLVAMRNGPRRSSALAALSGRPSAPAMPYVTPDSAACYEQG
jgi:hypothetical protein